MFSQLIKSALSFSNLFLCLFDNWLRWSSCRCFLCPISRSISFLRWCLLHKRLRPIRTDILLLAHPCSLITFLKSWTSRIVLAHADLGTVGSVLAVEYVCAFKINGCCVDVLYHVVLEVAVVVSHGQTVSEILCHVLLFFVININLILYAVNLCLNIIKWPLLRLLHLYHHLLYLFKLLEAVCLHLFKLPLLLNKHA